MVHGSEDKQNNELNLNNTTILILIVMSELLFLTLKADCFKNLWK